MKTSGVAVSVKKNWKKVRGRRIGKLLSKKWYMRVKEDSVDMRKDKGTTWTHTEYHIKERIEYKMVSEL